MQITLNGKLLPGVTAKDVMLEILGALTVNGGQYRSIEFAGDTIPTLPIDERPVIPNMMAEFGAMNAYFPPDQAVFDYLAARGAKEHTPLYPDADAVYEERHTFDVSALQPKVALPHQPDQVVALGEAEGRPIQQALLGTCTGGALQRPGCRRVCCQGRKVRIRFVVIPASQQVLLQALESGVLADLIEAGAAIATPGCGPCMGNHMGVPAPNEATISSGSRNFKGRMGTTDAPIYLANPYVVAASALTGEIHRPAGVSAMKVWVYGDNVNTDTDIPRQVHLYAQDAGGNRRARARRSRSGVCAGRPTGRCGRGRAQLGLRQQPRAGRHRAQVVGRRRDHRRVVRWAVFP